VPARIDDRDALLRDVDVVGIVGVADAFRDAGGPSIAVECAALLPEVNGSPDMGGECAGIVSNKWDALALHLNAGIGRTRDHTTARSLGLIAEGPDAWPVRPVAEIVAERESGGRWLNSALGGVIFRDTAKYDLAGGPVSCIGVSRPALPESVALQESRPW
jgi:hypothetical protein